MNLIKFIFLLFLLTLSFSCVEKKDTTKDTSQSELGAATEMDSLKFTSGIRAIFQDSQGNYWFGSHEEGVCFYDGKSYRYFTKENGLADNQIRAIQEDKDGKIWISTANGVSVYQMGAFTNYTTNWNQPFSNWNETKGDLWFYAHEEGGINRFDGEHMNYLTFPKQETKNPDDSFAVTALSMDKKGKLWIATYSALYCYDGNTIAIFGNEKLKLKNQERLHIRSVYADSKGRIWIGNNGIGVLLMDGNSTFNFSDKNKLIHPTSTKRGDKSKPGTLEHVFAIEEDSDGNIWFGDRDTGAWKYDGVKLTNYQIDPKLNDSMIWTIYKDKYDALHVGMAKGGVYKFNGNRFEQVF